MKNIFKTLAAFAVIALAVACSKDGAEGPALQEEATVSFDVQLPGGLASRATNDGTTAQQLFYAVYSDIANDATPLFTGETTINITATVSIDLVTDQVYDIVFWAQKKGKYTPDWNAKTIAMNYANGAAGADEERDAFLYVWHDLEVKGAVNEPVTLKRPFAQLNVGLTKGQIEKAANAGFELESVKVTAQTHNSFSFAAAQGAPADELATIEFAASAFEAPVNADGKHEITVEGTAYDWVSFNYLLACTPSELTNVEIVFNGKGGKTIALPAFASVPVERNHRTNIVGDLLTDPANFNVTIDPVFDEEDYVVEAWDGKTTKEPEQDAEGNYIIDESSELAWLAEQVNGVSRAETQTFKGKTVYLTKDINLGNHPWTPIGLNADAPAKFQGVLDGQNHTIQNLNVNTEAGYTAAGLFGALNGTAKNFTIENATIKHISTSSNGLTDNGIAVVAGSLYAVGHVDNVHVKNAKVEGNRYMGGISGYTYGNVKNCSVENLELIATPNEVDGAYDNGDKVGGIAGYFAWESVYALTGNKATNVTIVGYRDLGGIVGAGNAQSIKNNTIEGKLTITVDQQTYHYADKDANAAAIVGRVLSGEVDSSNVANGEISISQLVQDGVVKDLVTGDYTISNAAGLKWVANVVNATTPYTPTIFDDVTVKMANDIDLNNEEWIPIGDDRSQRTEWHGIFDGQGYTVKNVKITKKTDRDDENKSSYGLFGNVKGTVKNLTVDGVSISGAPKFVGALIGRLNNGLVENCHVKNANVAINNWTIGGVVGQWNDGKISGCSIENSTITGYAGAGAIAGLALNKGERTVENCSVKNCKVVQNGSFGYGDYDKMFGAIIGATYSGELVVNINGCSVEGTTVLGEATTMLYGFVAEGDKVLVDGQSLVYPSSLENMLKNEGATVQLAAMEYEWPSQIADDVTLIGVEGTVFKEVEMIEANNITVKNVKFDNEYGTALPLKASGLFENCEIVGSNGLYMGKGDQYMTGDLTFKNCTITGEVYGINANLSGYKLTLEECAITGWNSFGSNNSKEEKVVVNNCTFHQSSDGYNKLRFYQTAEVTNCVFDASASIDFDHPYQGSLDGKNITIEGCSVATVARGAEPTKIIELIDLSCLDVCTKTDVILDGTKLNANTLFIKDANELVAASSATISGGRSVVLLADIDLTGATYNGLFAFNSENNNTFDGMGYTVSNWTYTGGASDMGFIRQWVGPIKNVTINNAHLKTNGRSAVLAGKVYSNIDNCHVKNSTIEDSYWACALIAGHYNSGSVSNCSVEGSSVKSNGATGAIVGLLNESTGVRSFTNCTVKNTTVNNTGAYGEGYCGALICGMINISNSTVKFSGCSYEGNTKEGKYVGDLYYNDEGNTIVVE